MHKMTCFRDSNGNPFVTSDIFTPSATTIGYEQPTASEPCTIPVIFIEYVDPVRRRLAYFFSLMLTRKWPPRVYIGSGITDSMFLVEFQIPMQDVIFERVYPRFSQAEWNYCQRSCSDMLISVLSFESRDDGDFFLECFHKTGFLRIYVCLGERRNNCHFFCSVRTIHTAPEEN